MLGSIPRRAVAGAALLALAAPALAAEPGGDRGAEMLKALRQRDAAAAWAETASQNPTEMPVRPVVDPVFPFMIEDQAAPRLETAPSAFKPAAPGGPAWQGSRAAAGRSAGEPTFPRLAQETGGGSNEPANPLDDPLLKDDAEPGDANGNTQENSLDEKPGDVENRRATTPDQLRKIHEIFPYSDYEPEPGSDPCLNQCPRPDGLPCKTYQDGELTPSCPDEVRLGSEPFVPRAMPSSVFAWKASNLHYNPLYFEDVALERYGHTYCECVQPFVSVGKFGVQLVGLPYQMALDPPCKEVYPLGYYRPGERAPKLTYQIPFNARAAAVTAGFYTGAGAILP